MNYIFQTVLWMGAVGSTVGQWILNVTKEPCQHNGEFEFLCCKDSAASVILDIAHTNGQTVASTDFNNLLLLDNTVYPNYDIISDASCAMFTVRNFINGTLSFTCTMGSHILTTSAKADCSSQIESNPAAQTSNNVCKPYVCKDYESELIASCVSLVMVIALLVGIIIFLIVKIKSEKPE